MSYFFNLKKNKFMLFFREHQIAKILFICYITICPNCKQTQSSKNTFNSDEVELEIENEIEMLRKQIFLNFLNRHENFRKIVQDDGTIVYDNCVICLTFIIKDPNLEKISGKWFTKVYSNVFSNKNFYIMKSLDYMMSKDIDNYLDSVKVVISNDPESFDIIGKINKNKNLKKMDHK